jgi:hypothetical protein
LPGLRAAARWLRGLFRRPERTMSYAVKELLRTLQSEGGQSGRPSVGGLG